MLTVCKADDLDLKLWMHASQRRMSKCNHLICLRSLFILSSCSDAEIVSDPHTHSGNFTVELFGRCVGGTRVTMFFNLFSHDKQNFSIEDFDLIGHHFLLLLPFERKLYPLYTICMPIRFLSLFSSQFQTSVCWSDSKLKKTEICAENVCNSLPPVTV